MQNFDDWFLVLCNSNWLYYWNNFGWSWLLSKDKQVHVISIEFDCITVRSVGCIHAMETRLPEKKFLMLSWNLIHLWWHSLVACLLWETIYLLDKKYYIKTTHSPMQILSMKFLFTWLIGFAGYFDAMLYKDVHLGIEPSTATPNMFSWYDTKISWCLCLKYAFICLSHHSLSIA